MTRAPPGRAASGRSVEPVDSLMTREFGGQPVVRVEPAVVVELDALRQRLSELSGTVLATADGLLVAHDTHDLDAEGVAALAAAHLGLAQRFADVVGHGELRETVIECAAGYISTYAAGANTVLTVLSRPRANLARIHLEARRTAQRVAAFVDAPQPPVSTPPTPPAHPPPPRSTPSSAPPAPLARRTPMATLPPDVSLPRGGPWLNWRR